MRLFEGLNLGIRVPVLSIHLVAADMEKLVGKQLSHFLDELVHELVDLFPSGIGDRLIATFIFHGERPRVAGQFRIAHKPRTAVAGSIKLWNYPDAAIMREGDQVADFFLWV